MNNFCCFNHTFFFHTGPRGPRGIQGPPGPPGTVERVAFSVRLGNNFPESDETIKFRDVLVNEQNAYNIKTGIFTCKHPGTYEFSFFATVNQNSASLDLMRNGDRILHSFTTRQNGFITASGTVYVKLVRGDKVWLIATEGHNGLTSESIFSGHLMYGE